MNIQDILTTIDDGLRDYTPQEMVHAREKIIKLLDIMLQETVVRDQKQRLIEEDSGLPDKPK